MSTGGTTGAGYFFDRGNSHFRAGRYRLAIFDYNAALFKKSDYADAFIARSLAYAKVGDHISTVSDLTHFIQLKPENGQAYLLRGAALEAQQKSREALRDYERAINLNPTMIPAYLNRGRIRMRFGNVDGAIADFEAVLRLDPDHKEGANFRAIAGKVRASQLASYVPPPQPLLPPRNEVPFYLNKKNWVRWIILIITLIGLEGIVSSLFNADQNENNSVSNFITRTALPPRHTPTATSSTRAAAVAAANRCYNLVYSDLTQAKRECDAAIRLDPDYANAYNTRALVFMRMGDHDSAIADLRRAHRLNPALVPQGSLMDDLLAPTKMPGQR